MVCVVAPVDQRLPEPCDEVKVTVDPGHILVDPPAVIVGTAGLAFTVTRIGVELDEHPPPFV